jgi:ubiquinone/menaquinone biosynthesis C-methylase UbiE
MSKDDTEEIHDFWNSIADDWDIQVGDKGDLNRALNSDPVIWNFSGEVAGLKVLDAGCGTGYLSRMLHERGAFVIGIDFSEKMIEIARSKAPQISFQVDSCSELKTVDDGSVDLVIANYVLMDTPDLTRAIKAFNRVLKNKGLAVVVFSHPCFPQGRATASPDGQGVQYYWPFSYFERGKCIDPPWGHFASKFIWFHRPLSEYWKTFITCGFEVEGFDEPSIPYERYPLAGNEQKLNFLRTRPCSVAFKLRKKHNNI